MIEKYCIKLKKEYNLFITTDKTVIRLKKIAILYKTIQSFCIKGFVDKKELLKYVDCDEIEKLLIEYNLYFSPKKK